MQRPQQFTVTLQSVTRVDDEVRSFVFRPSVPFSFLHGQYVDLRFPGEKRYHAFSLASSCLHCEAFELVVKLHGPFTTKLFEAKEGDTLEALGPIGKFTDESGMDGDVVMIAGGVGVTPLLSVVRWARDAANKDREYWLFYSARTRSSLIHEEELRAMKDGNEHVHVVLTLTREQPDGWDGELGRVDGAMLAKHLGSLEGKTYYMCGPDAMVAGVKAMLIEAGVPEERMRFESWG